MAFLRIPGCFRGFPRCFPGVFYRPKRVAHSGGGGGGSGKGRGINTGFTVLKQKFFHFSFGHFVPLFFWYGL